VTSSSLNSHMASHSKEDIVAALLRQQSLPSIQPHSLHVMPGSSNSDFSNGRIVCQPSQPSSSTLSFNPIAQSQPVSLVKKSSADGTIMTSQHSQMPTFDMSMLPSTATAGPFLMPQMMGMMQVIKTFSFICDQRFKAKVQTLTFSVLVHKWNHISHIKPKL
jgi:hypothetical protein